MAWCIDDVDLDVVIQDCRVFCQDRDATLAFQVVGIHDTDRHIFVGAKYAALFQHGIDERRFAMVNVGDDCNISQVSSLHYLSIP